MFRTDRGTVVAACLMSALGCLMACALLGFPATGGVRFAWVLLWATASVAGMRFLRVQDRRAKACFGTFGALFVLALALGYRLDTAGQTGIEGLLLSLGTALCLGPAAGWAALWLDERMAALVPPQSATPEPAPQSATPATPEPAPQSATPACAPQNPATAAPRVPRHPLLAPMVLMLVAWTPLLLAFYPGIHAYDTFSQLPDYLAGIFSTHHPLLHTLLTGWLYDLGGLLGSHALGMLLYSVAQMLLVAWALAYGLCYLARLGCRRWVRLGLLALFCLGPQISRMSWAVPRISPLPRSSRCSRSGCIRSCAIRGCCARAGGWRAR